MYDSALVYAERLECWVLLGAHPTPSESVGKCLASIYSVCNISPPPVNWQASKAR